MYHYVSEYIVKPIESVVTVTQIVVQEGRIMTFHCPHQ